MYRSLFAVVVLSTIGTAYGNEGALELAKSNGCFACHSIAKKVIGPAWKDVSQRYQSDPAARTALINKVKTGGKGNWIDVTNGASMPPYWPRVDDEDIASIVDFILSL